MGLVHALWGHAKDGTPYDRDIKRKFSQLVEGLQIRAARDGWTVEDRPLQ
jgi:hypothetical protein